MGIIPEVIAGTRPIYVRMRGISVTLYGSRENSPLSTLASASSTQDDCELLRM